MNFRSLIFIIALLSILNNCFLLTDTGIVIADDSNFRSVLDREGSEYSLVYFYRDGCIHCSNFKPTYNQLSELYSDTNLQLVHVDAKINRNIQNSIQIKSFPTIMLYDQNVHRFKWTYKGDRSIYDLVNFLEKHTKISPKLPEKTVIRVNDLSEYKSIIDENSKSSKGLIITFTAPWLQDWDSDLNTYEKLSKKFGDKLKFVVIDGTSEESSDLTSLFKISHFPTFIYKENIKDENFIILENFKGINEEILEAIISKKIGHNFESLEALKVAKLEGNVENEKERRKYGISYEEKPSERNFDDDELFKRLREL
ncbi:hypothetical protein WICMUC_002295 [Wickerhamomyces mucosus]|uniref:Thioredoxin domain-containing protein n=1 Tax=Wickerhamomyces mucosus TaxID=1378264 RepID=A0A9P8PR55_9ASCO|nr:hypothetical protein WICMUC_002295 [Wickerhamomyces mucosus]